MIEKAQAIGTAFMTGIGPVGSVLLDIVSGPCLRIDDKRWSLNTSRGNLVLSQGIVDRLLKDEWVAISPEQLMSRDHLVLTEKGGNEAMHWALVRSIELAEQNDPIGVVVDEARPPVTTQARVFDLAQKGFELFSQSRREPLPIAALYVQEPDGSYVNLVDWFKGPTDDQPGRQMARLFAAIQAVAESAMYGLQMGDMPTRARWGGTIAAEAFERAPDQDWEFEDGNEGDE